jgi:hypothetical protein
MKKIILLAIVVSFLGCNKQSDKNLDLIQNEVMAIHDEVMPKMGDILNLKEKLNKQLTNTDSTKAEYVIIKSKIDSLKSQLVDADNQMMDWMNEYNVDTLMAINEEEGMKYLQAEKQKLTLIKAKTNQSIEAAKLFLKK